MSHPTLAELDATRRDLQAEFETVIIETGDPGVLAEIHNAIVAIDECFFGQCTCYETHPCDTVAP